MKQAHEEGVGDLSAAVLLTKQSEMRGNLVARITRFVDAEEGLMSVPRRSFDELKVFARPPAALARLEEIIRNIHSLI